jgi:superfamily II DNA or RNA helicase
VKPLRDYQTNAVNHLWGAFGNNEKVVLAASTGAGKTRLAAEVFMMAREKRLRVAFCVPFLSLIDQTFDAFVEAGMDEGDISIIQADNPFQNYAKPIQICSVDTLVRRKYLPEVDIVIFDEGHRSSKLYSRWMKEFPDNKFAALSATPWSRGMRDIWDRLIIVATTRDLITKGYLCDYKYFAPSSPDLSGVSIVAGDYHEGQLSDVMKKAELVADIVRTWKEKAEGRPTLAFCVSRDHAKEVQSQFLSEGISCGYVDAYTPVSERKELIKKLESGELKVLANIGTMTTGVDCPSIGCIIFARPTKSEMLFLQCIGRGLRIHPFKDKLLVLDHSDTGLNLGLPCTIHHEELLPGKVDKATRQAQKEAKEKLKLKPHKCKQCNHVHEATLMVCPSCGHIRKRASDVVMREGYLTELRLDGTQKASLNADMALRQDWYSGFLFIALEKGYKEGWAFHKFVEKFKSPPDGLRKVAKQPSLSVRSYIRSKQIAFAKARAKAEGYKEMGKRPLY